MINYDVIIIGAGPVGLAFAQSLARENISVLLLEKNSHQMIAKPAVDGREIALTHASVNVLKKLGAWQRIDKKHISFIDKAMVFDEGCQEALVFDRNNQAIDCLGYLVPNYLIRQSLFDSAIQHNLITIKNDVTVKTLTRQNEVMNLTLDNGETLSSNLVVAADSRFSQTRNKMAISADMKDFSRTMVVCQMSHSKPHQNIASEHFQYQQIIATLPMPEQSSSIVITLTTDKAAAAMAMAEKDFNAYVTELLNGQLGEMSLLNKRHSYPLTAVYATQFVQANFALIGDAAVAMHPVTAHGFNLGLRGQDILANTLALAKRRHQKIGDLTTLVQYQRKFRLVSKTIYLGTNSIVFLFSSHDPLMRKLRPLTIKLSNRLPFVKSAISAHLTERYRKTRNLLPFLS